MNRRSLSAGLYKDGLRRIKVPAIIFAAVIFLMQFIVPITSSGFADSLGDLSREVMNASKIMASLSIVSVVMTPILILVMFFAFNRRSSADFYHSLPYTRECIFFSWTAAALTVSTLLVIFGTALGYVSRIMFPRLYIVSLAGMGDMLLSIFAAMIFGAACTLIGMSLTGTFISNAVCTLLFMFLPRFILWVIRSFIMELSVVLSSEYFIPWMDLDYNVYITGIPEILSGNISMYGFSSGAWELWIGNIRQDISTLAIGIIYMIIAAALFKCRRSESAGQSSTGRNIQHIIRIALTFAVSLPGTYLIFCEDYNWNEFAVISYSLALIIFFAYEIITTKRWKNLLRILPSLPIVIGLNILVWIAASATSSVILNRQISAEEVNGVRVYDVLEDYYGDSSYFSDKANKVEIKDADLINMLVDTYNDETEDIKNGESYRYYYYTDENGIPSEVSKYERLVAFNTDRGTVYRTIWLTDLQYEDVLEAVSEMEEFYDLYTEIPQPEYSSMYVSISGYSDETSISEYLYADGDSGFDAEDAREIYQTLTEELAGVDKRQWLEFIINHGAEDSCSIVISYSDDSASSNTINIKLSQRLTPKTYALALQNAGSSRNKGDIEGLISYIDSMTDEQWESIWDYGYLNIQYIAYSTDAAGNVCEKGLNMYSGDGVYDRDDYIKILKDALEADDAPTEKGWILLTYYASFYLEDKGEYIDYQGETVLPLIEGYADLQDIQTGLTV